MAITGTISSRPKVNFDRQSTSSSMDICNQDTTVPPDNTSCADCIAAATDAAVSVAKFAGVACQQAAFCLVATCVSLFEPSATQLESEHVYTSSSPDSSSGILQGLYAPPLPLTMAEPPCTLWKGFAGSRPSAFVGQLTVTVWTNDFFQQPDRTMQVWAAWQLVLAIFHRRVDIPFLQQRHMLNMLQHIVNMMSMDAHACQEASKQAARHEGMQLVSPMYRPWLAQPDCMLTWQQMTAALSWQQIVQVMDIVAAPLSADDRDIHLHPINAFVPLCLEWMMWQARLAHSTLHAANDTGAASPGVHAEALRAQHFALRGRSRRSTHRRSLAAIAVSHVVIGPGSAQRRRVHGQLNRKSLSSIKSASQICSNSKQFVTSQLSQHVVSDTGHFFVLRTASQSSVPQSGHSLSPDPLLKQQGPVIVPQNFPLSQSSGPYDPSCSPTPLLGKQTSPHASPRSAGVLKVSVISCQSSSLNSSQQALVGQLTADNHLSDTPALQSIELANNASSQGQNVGLQLTVSARGSRTDASFDGRASESHRHRLSRCTHAADLPLEAEHSIGDKQTASSARQWFRSVSWKGEALRAEVVREAGRVIRRVSTGDLAIKASAMTDEAKKKSSEWLQARKDSWSIPALSLQNAGRAETVEVISEEECCTVFKPLPMMTGRDGQYYSPLQAAGHVLSLEKKTVDAAVTGIRTAASAVAEATLTAKLHLATALGGMSRRGEMVSGGLSEVVYLPVATGLEAQTYTPMQAVGHVMGVRREPTDALVTSMQKAVPKLQGSGPSEPEAWPLQPG